MAVGLYTQYYPNSHFFSLCTKPTALSAKIKRSKFGAICKKKCNIVFLALKR